MLEAKLVDLVAYQVHKVVDEAVKEMAQQPSQPSPAMPPVLTELLNQQMVQEVQGAILKELQKDFPDQIKSHLKGIHTSLQNDLAGKLTQQLPQAVGSQLPGALEQILPEALGKILPALVRESVRQATTLKTLPPSPAPGVTVQEAITEALAQSDKKWAQRMEHMEKEHQAQLLSMKAQLQAMEQNMANMKESQGVKKYH